MKNYFKIQIEIKSEEQAEILIASLSEIRFYAFDEADDFLNAYIREEDFDEKKLKNILPSETLFNKQIIKEENWNKQWESGVKPVVIGDFVGIRPYFAQAIDKVKHDIIITPKMSFGTGHHATTYLMIEIMENIDFYNKSVIDFGTGTGVLAILAEKCGASCVTAIDLDEWSMKNASENIKANNCHRILLRQQNDLAGIESADIILANINLNVLKNEVSSIASAVKKSTFLLASGFLLNDLSEMENVFEGKGFVKCKTEQHEDWLAILFRKK